MAAIPHGADAQALPPCDLVMKGGVTSGIVYPPVVEVLSGTYRFASIGGTSAGAIAAAVTAAAEYARQRGDAGAIERLRAPVEELKQPGALLALFQPLASNRPLFNVLWGSGSHRATETDDSGQAPLSPPPRRVLERAARIAWAAMRARPATLLAALLGIVALAVLSVAAFDTLPVVVAVLLCVAAIALAVVLVAATVVLALALVARQAYRALEKTQYGMCPGTNQGGGKALIDWLDEHIQACAGRTTNDPPLTFGELREQGITLTMMTTDLSFARPVRIPDELDGYLFDPKELRTRFPKRVVDAMIDDDELADESSAPLRHQWVPTDDLPVLVGTRLSLSFPILLSAMPLYLPNRLAASVSCHMFSDGGISSNFPVQFFDAWFPGHPTFGIDLTRHPDDGGDSVFMPRDPVEPLAPRLREVDSLRTFVANIIDTMQNWRDSLQSELPGFRDRICQIRMRRGEGGLALNMPPALVEHLADLGAQAGERILEVFGEDRWEAHRWIRYVTMASQLQGNLQKADGPFAEFAPALAAGLPGVDFAVYRKGRGVEWCRSAGAATSDLLALAGTWGPGRLVDFCGSDLPAPIPVMRVVPKA